MAELTANQLYKLAVSKELTNVPFAEWIENKNIEYGKFVSNEPIGGKVISFSEWEAKNQDNQTDKGVSTNSKLVGGIVLIGVMATIVYFIYKNKKK